MLDGDALRGQAGHELLRQGPEHGEDSGHRQEDGDYRESWQPHPMAPAAEEACRVIARQVTATLGGFGLFGVEFFVNGDQVYFSEVSPGAGAWASPSRALPPSRPPATRRGR